MLLTALMAPKVLMNTGNDESDGNDSAYNNMLVSRASPALPAQLHESSLS